MKKYLLLALVTLLFVSVTAFQSQKEISYSNQETLISKEYRNCKRGRCTAIAKSTGDRCKNCITKTSDFYCWVHRNN